MARSSGATRDRGFCRVPQWLGFPDGAGSVIVARGFGLSQKFLDGVRHLDSRRFEDQRVGYGWCRLCCWRFGLARLGQKQRDEVDQHLVFKAAQRAIGSDEAPWRSPERGVAAGCAAEKLSNGVVTFPSQPLRR